MKAHILWRRPLQSFNSSEHIPIRHNTSRLPTEQLDLHSRNQRGKRCKRHVRLHDSAVVRSECLQDLGVALWFAYLRITTVEDACRDINPFLLSDHRLKYTNIRHRCD